MDAEVLSIKERNPTGFMTLLSYAFCEWFVILLLFVDAALSYFLTKFAEYCDLKKPCLLCSRLDLNLGKKKSGCYWSLFCSSHREEISSLVPCSVHEKLADGNDMCEECFMPFARQNKPHSQSYRLLVGKLWVDVEQSLLQNLMLNKRIRYGSTGCRTCSCCTKTWRAKSNAEKLLGLTTIGLGASKVNMKPLLPRVQGCSRFSRRDSLKRLREKFTGPKTQVDIVASENVLKPSVLDLNENKNINFPSSSAFKQHGMRELDWAEYYQKLGTRLTAELISSDDKSQPRNTVIFPEKHTNDGGTSEIGKAFSAKHIKDVAETTPHNAHSPDSNSMNLTDASTQNDENIVLVSKRETETRSISNSPKDGQAIKSSLDASTCEVGSLSKAGSPRVNVKHNDFKVQEDDNSPTLPISDALERNDSGNNESLDGISDGDIIGEAIVDRLKRQIEHDQSCIGSLYIELEEERNAAAVAANQAMAMITRLQQEKASVHMEALQYLRLMDEQADYDLEALERANDLLAEKEKELQDLEAELEVYRNNFADKEKELQDLEAELEVYGNKFADKEKELQNLEAELEMHRNNYADKSLVENSLQDSSDSESSTTTKAIQKCKPMLNSVSDFIDEKLYISQCLNTLEKSLHQVHCSRKLDETSNGLDSENVNEEKSTSFQNGKSASSGDHPVLDSALNDHPNHDMESDLANERRENLSAYNGESSVDAFEKEIMYLHHRLEAMETDQDFLRRVSNMLQNGKDGLHLIQEITHHLQELRKVVNKG